MQIGTRFWYELGNHSFFLLKIVKSCIYFDQLDNFKSNFSDILETFQNGF